MNRIEYTGRDNLEVMREAINYNKYLLDLVISSAQKNDAIVDFGAGNGTFSFPVATSGYSVICVEIDPLLSAGLANQGMKVLTDFDQAEDGSIDYIYSLNTLEHIEDDTDIAALWYRKLRIGGKLLVYVPAFQFLFSSMDQKVGHIRRYSKSSLNQKITAAGFEITESRYVDSIGYIATIAYRMFGKADGAVDRNKLKLYDRWLFPFSRRLDAITHQVLGKNVYAIAVKTERKHS